LFVCLGFLLLIYCGLAKLLACVDYYSFGINADLGLAKSYIANVMHAGIISISPFVAMARPILGI